MVFGFVSINSSPGDSFLDGDFHFLNMFRFFDGGKVILLMRLKIVHIDVVEARFKICNIRPL